MNSIYKYIIALVAIILIASSCTNVVPLDVDDQAQQELLDRDMKRWAEEQSLQKAQDESDAEYRARIKKMYDEYYAAIRAYKKDPNHKIVYGWFRAEMWKAMESEPGSFLFNLADSIDVVSIWGGIEEFGEDDPRWQDLKLAQEVKGLKVLLCWQTGRSGLGLPGGANAFNERHPEKNSVEKAIAYAQELTEHIKRLNLNGYDIDWEPTVGDHNRNECANLYRDCDDPNGNSSAPIEAFITEMGKNFGPKATSGYNPRNSGTMFLFDGEISDMASRFPHLGDYFDYFIDQNYWRISSRYVGESPIKGWSNKKLVLADEFERYDGYKNGGGGQNGYYGNEAYCIAKAKFIKRNDLGGWACYHIELDPEYKWSRQVIQIMNPTTAFFPDDNNVNDLLD